MTRRVTTHDLAREAGVSRTTVSHVLNNQPGINLSPKTRERVLATARKLGYVPNSAAQMLVTGRSRCIGLVLSRPDLLAVDAFVAIMTHGLNEVCRERGYRLIMEAIQGPPGDDAYSNLAKSKRVDSLIIINPRKGDNALKRIIKSKFPVLIAGTTELPGENAITTQEGQASCQDHRPLDIARTPANCPHLSCFAGLRGRLPAFRRLSRGSGNGKPPVQPGARHPRGLYLRKRLPRNEADIRLERSFHSAFRRQ